MSTTAPLTLLEEIVLLALDDAAGVLRPLPPLAFGCALSGALLSDLALQNRIDTDPEQLVVINREPTGDALLDAALATLAAAPAPHPVAYWLDLFSQQQRDLESTALHRLVERGILRREEKKILWVFGTRRYPTIDNQERTEVLTRLSALILGDDIPDPRDSIMLSLLIACGLAGKVFVGPEFNARSARLSTLAKLDLVGREVAAAINVVTRALYQTLPAGL